MNATVAPFIVVILGDSDAYGYDQHAIPVLAQIVESSSPDARTASHLGFVAYCRTSASTLEAVKILIADAEALRQGDSRFASLGIGLAEGELVAECDSMGRVSIDRIAPMGGAVNDASSCFRERTRYRDVFANVAAQAP